MLDMVQGRSDGGAHLHELPPRQLTQEESFIGPPCKLDVAIVYPIDANGFCQCRVLLDRNWISGLCRTFLVLGKMLGPGTLLDGGYCGKGIGKGKLCAQINDCGDPNTIFDQFSVRECCFI